MHPRDEKKEEPTGLDDIEKSSSELGLLVLQVLDDLLGEVLLDQRVTILGVLEIGDVDTSSPFYSGTA